MQDQILEYHGFGPIYSGIFIISTLVTIYMICSYAKQKKFEILIPYLLILFGMILLVFATDGSWWARYSPYLYLLPISNILYLVNKKHIFSNILGGILSILLIINVSLIIYANIEEHFPKYNNIRESIRKFENYVNANEQVEVALRTTGFEGIKYNLSDLNIDMNKIVYVKKIQNQRKGVYFFSYHDKNIFSERRKYK